MSSSKYTTEQIKKRMEELGPWYQNINLNGNLTKPNSLYDPENLWKNIESNIPNDLSGKTVLDLGCNAGFFSIKMRQKGAEVLGLDWSLKYIKQAKFTADVLNLEIDFQQRNIYEFILNDNRTFDYVIFLGLFYHLRYPLLVLDKIGRITKEKLIFLTLIRGPTLEKEIKIPDKIKQNDREIFNDLNFPLMYFIEKNYESSDDDWFFCNKSGVFAILRSSGFKNIIHVKPRIFICEPSKQNPKWLDGFLIK